MKHRHDKLIYFIYELTKHGREFQVYDKIGRIQTLHYKPTDKDIEEMHDLVFNNINKVVNLYLDRKEILALLDSKLEIVTPVSS